VAECLSARDFPAPYQPAAPVTFRVQLATIDRAEAFRGRTGVRITGPRTVESTGQTFWEAWDQFWYQ